MSLHLLDAILQSAVSLRQVVMAKVLDQRLGIGIKIFSEFHFGCQSHLENLHWVVIHKWRPPINHFIDHDP